MYSRDDCMIRLITAKLIVLQTLNYIINWFVQSYTHFETYSKVWACCIESKICCWFDQTDSLRDHSSLMFRILTKFDSHCLQIWILNVLHDMNYSQELYFWQFVIINWFREMIANQILRDCILENYMNFDKTIEIIAYLLTIRSKRLSVYSFSFESDVEEDFLYTFLLFLLDNDVEKDFLYIFSSLLKVMLRKTFLIFNKTIERNFTQAHRKCLSNKSFR